MHDIPTWGTGDVLGDVLEPAFMTSSFCTKPWRTENPPVAKQPFLPFAANGGSHLTKRKKNPTFQETLIFETKVRLATKKTSL